MRDALIATEDLLKVMHDATSFHAKAYDERRPPCREYVEMTGKPRECRYEA